MPVPRSRKALLPTGIPETPNCVERGLASRITFRFESSKREADSELWVLVNGWGDLEYRFFRVVMAAPGASSSDWIFPLLSAHGNGRAPSRSVTPTPCPGPPPAYCGCRNMTSLLPNYPSPTPCVARPLHDRCGSSLPDEPPLIGDRDLINQVRRQNVDAYMEILALD